MGGSGSFASRSRRLQEQASRPSAKAGSPQTLCNRPSSRGLKCDSSAPFSGVSLEVWKAFRASHMRLHIPKSSFPIRIGLLFALTGFAVLNGCRSRSVAGSATFSVDTLEVGRILVENSGDPAWPGNEPWGAREELRIGSVEGLGPTEFGLISALEVGVSGRIFVADYMAQEIRAFEPDGSYSFSFGRRGEGPGEFLALMGLRFDPQGRLWTRDNHNLRYEVFSGNGEYLFSHPMPMLGLGQGWEPFFDSGGGIVDWSVELPFSFHGPSASWNSEDAVGAGFVYRPIRSEPEKQDRDSLPPLFQEVDYLEGRMVPRPFSPVFIFHTDPQGRTWVSDSGGYRIFRRDLSGDTTLVLTLQDRPELVTSEERLAVSKAWIPGEEIPLDQILDEKPIVRLMTSDGEGHFFVFPNLEDVPAGTAVDVFFESGVFVGRVPLPVKLELRPEPVVRFPFMYGVVKDEQDVEYVVRLRIGPEVS